MLLYIQKDELKEAEKYIPEGFKVKTFCESCTIDKNVGAVKIGGHSKGSCIVKIGDSTVFVGDECYIRECITKKKPTGASICPQKSREFIEKYGNGKYDLLFSHGV